MGEKIMGPNDMDGQTPRRQDGPATEPDSPVTVTRPPDQGHCATVEVIPSDADRLHLNRSGSRE